VRVVGLPSDSVIARGTAHLPRQTEPRSVAVYALAVLLTSFLDGCSARHHATAERSPGSDDLVKPERSDEDDASSRVGSSRSSTTCGELTCDGAQPHCGLDGATGRAWCTEEGAREGDDCPVDGRHHQLECGRAADCEPNERCCYFDQMSHCATECPHFGQLCDSDADCSHFADLGQPARCRAVSETLRFLTACQVE